jgi:membrane protein
LFALFPLIFLMMTLFGLFASDRVELQNDLLSYFADFLPPSAFVVLKRVTAEIATHPSPGQVAVGVVSALWCISGCVDSMVCFLNAAYHVRESRRWFKVRAIALVLGLLSSVLILAALFIVLLGSRFVGWVGAGLGLHPLVMLAWKAIQWPIALFFVALSCSLIYYFGPDLKGRRRWRWFTPGAAFGAFIWVTASLGFRVYLHFFNSYSVSYGSLGGLMILLVWLYATGLSCLIGAEINTEIERRSMLATEPGVAADAGRVNEHQEITK